MAGKKYLNMGYDICDYHFRNNWDLYAPVYDLFMRKDRRAYEQMYRRIRRVIAGKNVLELATGTGLIAKNVAASAKNMEATDFSEKMIKEAKKGDCPANCRFVVEDACHLSYAADTFDVVIISNALHIMPEPEKALAQIRRVLKPGGLLVAPTFTHGKMVFSKQMLSKLMGIVGFKTEHGWTEDEYAAFLERNGWHITGKKTLRASFPLTYVECR